MLVLNGEKERVNNEMEIKATVANFEFVWC